MALDTVMRYHGHPPRCIILIEPMFFDRRVESDFAAYTSRVHRYNKKREHIWQTLDEAMAFHVKRLPWNAWHPEVLNWFSVSNRCISPLHFAAPRAEIISTACVLPHGT